MNRMMGKSARNALTMIPIAILVVLALNPSDGLHTYVGVPLRRISGSVAAGCLDLLGLHAAFDRFVLTSDGATPLLVVPECAGLRRMLVLVALALVVARVRRADGRRTAALVLLAAGLAILGNGFRLAIVSRFFPTVADRSGIGGALHDGIGAIPLAAAAFLIVVLGTRVRVRGDASSSAIGVLLAFGALLCAFAAPGDAMIPLARACDAAGLDTRVVDPVVDGEFGGVASGREIFGGDAPRGTMHEIVVEPSTGASWPDVYAFRFARAMGHAAPLLGAHGAHGARQVVRASPAQEDASR